MSANITKTAFCSNCIILLIGGTCFNSNLGPIIYLRLILKLFVKIVKGFLIYILQSYTSLPDPLRPTMLTATIRS